MSNISASKAQLESVTVWSQALARDMYLLPRDADDKYRRGVVGLATGSSHYPGAAVLTCGAAARSGAGMVRYAGPSDVSDRVLNAFPEIVVGIGRTQVWVIGSGTPWNIDPRALAVLSAGTPIVLDAGGIMLANATERHRLFQPTIITPHAGELARLLATYDRDVTPDDVSGEPEKWATIAANVANVVVLLKGHETTIVTPQGAVLKSAHAPNWLATAGSGDVLAGLLGGLIAIHAARGILSDERLAQLGATAAWLHGEAGSRASNGGPIVASDVIREIPRAIALLVDG